MLERLKTPGNLVTSAELYSFSDKRSIDQIRRLPPEEYHRSYPVQIEGVITVCDPIWKLLFIEDDSGGIYVYESIPQPELKAGQKVRVKGFTAPGMFSPIVSDPGIEILGPGEWPVARTITYAQAITGHEDAQWTEIIGVVHQVRHENGHTEIDLEISIRFVGDENAAIARDVLTAGDDPVFHDPFAAGFVVAPGAVPGLGAHMPASQRFPVKDGNKALVRSLGGETNQPEWDNRIWENHY